MEPDYGKSFRWSISLVVFDLFSDITQGKEKIKYGTQAYKAQENTHKTSNIKCFGKSIAYKDNNYYTEDPP